MITRFPGQLYDAATQLSYNYYRDYNPRTGRYTTSDPIGLAGGINTYAYVENDPLRYIDPEGTDLQSTLSGMGLGWLLKKWAESPAQLYGKTCAPKIGCNNNRPDGVDALIAEHCLKMAGSNRTYFTCVSYCKETLKTSCENCPQEPRGVNNFVK